MKTIKRIDISYRPAGQFEDTRFEKIHNKKRELCEL